MPVDRSRPERPRVTAAVLAGGVGARMGGPRPKQLMRLAGRTILEHSVATFCASPDVDEVIVLMVADHLAEAEKIVAEGGHSKVSLVAAGGASRTETSWAALRALADRDGGDLVLLHDAVRPLVGRRTIAACVAALRESGAVGAAVPSSDTVVLAGPGRDGSEAIQSVPGRASLRRMQTPQGFRLDVIRRAYERALADPGLVATDDCGVVLRYLPEEEVRLVPGEEDNIKVTHPGDIAVAEALLRVREEAR
ncbi:IspD/TarI family cytidylyltransferase [Actinorugispora endophytica]|uniref:2-C-methyl-D-erythritol 4-phosphate cytidylyltransferase n=1 Tax=Actinorugispora endophytica TaxID=1605990 RepID=A0A4R6UXF4_9ACTN|nr:IspD/TarI family cytidylyltransferase [Actinorugispora endophytica]TDQ51911.1 2-C-methyl-D-erythritol 4-phosphate cytidylyltransferase [Actinorugispora endophytica]